MELSTEAVARLASGRAHDSTFRSSFGWAVRVHRQPILSNSELVVSDYSQGAWRRELSLTLYAGQHLPRLLAGGSSIELYHEASGVRIGFCALEALRAWALLDLPPVQHLSPIAAPPEWEYTFTTAYPGSVVVAPLGCDMPVQPDESSFYPRPALELASGRALPLAAPVHVQPLLGHETDGSRELRFAAMIAHGAGDPRTVEQRFGFAWLDVLYQSEVECRFLVILCSTESRAEVPCCLFCVSCSTRPCQHKVSC